VNAFPLNPPAVARGHNRRKELLRVNGNRTIVVLGSLLALAMLASGCGQHSSPSAVAAAPSGAGGGAPPPPPEVLFTLPDRGQIVDYEEFTGRTVANKTIEIRARVTGYIDKINFKEIEGRDVEMGTVLFEIDPRPYEAEVARAEANLLQANTRLKRVELDYERALKTVATRTITQEQFDQVAGDRAEAKAQVEIMKANLDLARLNLSYTKVKAPISGRVSRTKLDQGNLVKADDTVLATIVSMDPMYAYFELDERTLLKLRRAADDQGTINTQNETAVPVEMALADEQGYPHSGMVDYFDNQLDAGTGTLQARGVFDNADRMLSPGMFVRVRVPIGKPYHALLLPEQALGTDQGQKFVYVIDGENKAQYRRVQVGRLQNGRRAILDGVSEGERVVVSGLQRIRPGTPVTHKPASAEPVVSAEQQQAEVSAAAAAKAKGGAAH
jgi:multidrug efflux system membrane fusion protein